MSPTRDLLDDDLELFATLSLDLLAVATTERLVWVSPRWTEVLGWTAEELVSQPFLAFVHPDDIAPTVAEASRLRNGEKTAQFLNRYRCKDGTFRWLEWNTSIAVNGRLYCITRDVTHRVEAEQELAQRAKLVEMSQRMMKMGHWSIDLTDGETWWSPEVYAVHGQDPKHFTPTVARSIADYHPGDRALVAEKLTRALEFGEPFEFEARVVHPTGEVRLVQKMGQARLGPTGELAGAFGIVRDITDDDRVRRTEELEQFAYVASHDLRQPVRTIRQYMQLLVEDYDLGLDEEGHRYWGFVRSAAERLDRLVRDLGRYTRAGDASRPGPVELSDVVGIVVERLGDDFEERGGGVSIHGPLPRVLGDGDRLRQVFDNLLDNALRYTGDAPPRVTITSVSGMLSGTTTLVISDQGSGFDPSDSEKIFEPFRRLASHDDEGTGIGLAIVRRIVQSLGGKVWAQGEAGRGATFFLRLPLAQRDHRLTPSPLAAEPRR